MRGAAAKSVPKPRRCSKQGARPGLEQPVLCWGVLWGDHPGGGGATARPLVIPSEEQKGGGFGEVGCHLQGHW